MQCFLVWHFWWESVFHKGIRIVNVLLIFMWVRMFVVITCILLIDLLNYSLD